MVIRRAKRDAELCTRLECGPSFRAPKCLTSSAINDVHKLVEPLRWGQAPIRQESETITLARQRPDRRCACCQVQSRRRGASVLAPVCEQGCAGGPRVGLFCYGDGSVPKPSAAVEEKNLVRMLSDFVVIMFPDSTARERPAHGGVRCQGELRCGEKKLKPHGGPVALRDACETSQGSRGGGAQGRAIGRTVSASDFLLVLSGS